MAVNITRKSAEVEITSRAGASDARLTAFEAEDGNLFLAGWNGERSIFGLAISRDDAITFGAALEELGRQ